jgi:hypothetical protein
VSAVDHLPKPLPEGCSICHTQDTATVDGFHGRRCANHPPTFDPDRAVRLHLAGHPGAALAYVRTTFPGEAA